MSHDNPMVLESPVEGHTGRQTFGARVDAMKLALVALCALGGTFLVNAVYDGLSKARASHAFMEKTRPSESYLTARRSPPIDHERIDDVSFEFSHPYDEAALPNLLGKADQCWKAYDASPTWEQFDYCAAYDIGVTSIVPPEQIQAFAKLSGYPSANDRRAGPFLIAKAGPLNGEHVVIQRANDIALTIQIDNR